MRVDEEIDNAILTLGILEHDAYQKLLDYIRNGNSFFLRKNEVRDLANYSILQPDDIANMLSKLSELQNFLINKMNDVDYKSARDEYIQSFSEGFEDIVGEQEIKSATKRFEDVFKYDPEFNNIVKAQRLKQGYLDIFDSISTFVDIRPSFEDLDGEIGDIKFSVISLQVKISLYSFDREAKEDYVFSISEDDVDEIIKSLLRAKNKIEKVKELDLLKV